MSNRDEFNKHLEQAGLEPLPETKSLSHLTGAPQGSLRTESPQPVNFRFAIYPDGQRRLQGAYPWSAGFSESGVAWRDIPSVHVNEDGESI